MPKTVTLCTRVEGHGSLRFTLQENEISGVYFDIKGYRGFENILSNKKIIDVPRIISRVCGLCYASHAIASCKGIEKMFELEPSDQSILLRRLLMTGELINSHSIHFFFQALPDLFVLLKGQSNPTPLEDLLRFDPNLTKNIFELIKLGKELITIFGGRSAHPITPVIGGISHAPSKKSIGIGRKYLQQALSNIKEVLERFKELFAQDEPPTELSLKDHTFLALHNRRKYDRYNGVLQLKQNKKVLADFSVEDYPKHLNWRDDVPGQLPGIYSVIEDSRLFVGPISRYNIIEDYGLVK
ncbi:MAG: nickel-dependent hydrogenase large subunit [Candidatus Helarchaeota archaeon]|nr:nickel-dependent hydrogenase large subunit [Candidatus Helarchaeota archaeon]